MMTETIKDAAGPGRSGRMSRQRKREADLRLLRGEDLETERLKAPARRVLLERELLGANDIRAESYFIVIFFVVAAEPEVISGILLIYVGVCNETSGTELAKLMNSSLCQMAG